MRRLIRLISLLLVLILLSACSENRRAVVARRGEPTNTPVAIPTVEAPLKVAEGAIERAIEPEMNSTPGRLVLIDHSLYPHHKLVLFDLVTEEMTTLFDVPEHGWLYQVDVSKNASSMQDGQIALAYAAPPERDPGGDGTVQRQPYDRSGIYLLSLDAPTEPVLLIGNRAANEHLFNPVWSPDGQSIYYVLYRRLTTTGGDAQSQSQKTTPDVGLYRYDLESGEHTFIVQDGVWPRVSPDGERLVYIRVDPTTTDRTIHLTDPDGGNGIELVATNAFFDVDTPHFSADSQWVYFSAVSHSTKVLGSRESGHVAQSWWEWLLGVKVAHAHTDHNTPSDWWRVPITGGEPERITAMRRIISYGEFDDSGERLFFATTIGVYRMGADGADVKRLPLPNLYRFMVWTES